MSPAAVRAVALAVFKESVRDRVPYSLVLFSVVLMAAAVFMSRLTASQDLKVIKDLGLASMNLIGLLIALFIGSLATVALTMVLMGLVFVSDRGGRDASVYSAHIEQDGEEPPGPVSDPDKRRSRGDG